MPEHTKGKKIEIWWQDEARFGQKGNLIRTWAEKGSRPRLLKDQRFEYVYIFGAVCPEHKKGAAIVVPFSNTNAMNEHLKEISINVDKNSHAIVLMDQAGWHRSKDLSIPENITIVLLPPYSPELNSQENIWQYLRDKFLSLKIFNNYDEIVNACVDAWNALMKMPEKIESIASRKWALASVISNED